MTPLFREGSRSYVQTAGASYKALVEFRQVKPDGSFSHYVLGRPGGDPTPTSIYSSIGTLHLNQNEIFKLPEILEIFRAFYDGRTVPGYLARRDITAQFSDG